MFSAMIPLELGRLAGFAAQLTLNPASRFLCVCHILRYGSRRMTHGGQCREGTRPAVATETVGLILTSQVYQDRIHRRPCRSDHL